MIEYFEGTVFNVESDAIVNTVNCIGVMSAGIALEYALRYPEMFLDYENRCKNKEIKVGDVYYFKYADKIIINFPTKWHFKYPSKLEWIESGLKSFVRSYKDYGITSVAFPKLGTLNGKLSWDIVKKLMEKYLGDIDIKVYICLDNLGIASGIEKQMLDIFNKTDLNVIKKEMRITQKQMQILNEKKPFNRFWKIHELEGIGISLYKNLHAYCFDKATKKRSNEQLSFFK